MKSPRGLSGAIPGGGGTQRLPRFVGMRKAKEMIFTSRLISAQEALELGVVNMVLPKEKLSEEAAKICEKMKSKSPASLRLAKQAINLAFSVPLDEGLRIESGLYSKVLTSQDAKEGLGAFLEGRRPNYTSK